MAASWVITTPLGVPVLPDVKIIYAALSKGTSRFWGSTPRTLISSDTHSVTNKSGTNSKCSLSVKIRSTLASSKIALMRSTGWLQFIGKYVFPVDKIARIAATCSTPFGRTIAIFFPSTLSSFCWNPYTYSPISLYVYLFSPTINATWLEHFFRELKKPFCIFSSCKYSVVALSWQWRFLWLSGSKSILISFQLSIFSSNLSTK